MDLPNVAPQYRPTIEALLSKRRFAGTFSMGPLANPTTTSLAPQFTHFKLGINFPTGSNTTSTPLPPVTFMTSFYLISSTPCVIGIWTHLPSVLCIIDSSIYPCLFLTNVPLFIRRSCSYDLTSNSFCDLARRQTNPPSTRMDKYPFSSFCFSPT